MSQVEGGLVVFLRARLDEREAIAKAAGGDDPADWFTAAGWLVDAEAEFIAGNSPAFVLADVAAKRQIIERVVPAIEALEDSIWNEARCSGQLDYDESRLLLRVLALSYAGHPDYRAEWAL